MSIDATFHGSLLANDFLCESVVETPDWQAIDAAALGGVKAALRTISAPFSIAGAFRRSIVAP